MDTTVSKAVSGGFSAPTANADNVHYDITPENGRVLPLLLARRAIALEHIDQGVSHDQY